MLADIDGVRPGQVAIEDGIITAVGAGLGKPDHVFDDGCLIFAGMGDIHIHARQDVTGRENYKETFATAAAAALHGGVVHVADMPNNPAAPVDDASYAAKEQLVAASALPITFTLYGGVGPGTRPLSRKVPYKAYMGPSVGELYFRNLEDLDRTLGAYVGQAVSFHCEDPILLEQHRGAPTHEARRPPECELSATRFALAMIEKYRLTGKLCHYSVGEGLPLIRAAKAKGVPVSAEVTPHHVFFDTARPDRAESAVDADESAAAQSERSCRDAGGVARRHRRLSRHRSRAAHDRREGTRHLRPAASRHLWTVRHLAAG